MYVCYLITNDRYTYVGITNNLTRRLRQHIGQLAGGARRTFRCAQPGKPWTVAACVTNIEHHNDALSFEKRVHIRRRRGAASAIATMQVVLAEFQARKVIDARTGQPRDASTWTLEIF